ncbi:MAG: 50S ribosomal protein L6 [Nitrososphaeria archaeon]|jgi:large subunit ribosomal protein L6
MSTEAVKQVLYSEEIQIPKGISVKLENKTLKVKGPKGECEKDFSKMKVNIEVNADKIIVSSVKKRKDYYAVARSVVKHIRNLIEGVQKNYVYKLKIVYSHFPIQVKVEKDRVRIDNFIGERFPRFARIVGSNTKVSVEGDDIIVEGPCKEAVGQTAGNIENATKIKYKDPRVFLDGVYIYERS